MSCQLAVAIFFFRGLLEVVWLAQALGLAGFDSLGSDDGAALGQGCIKSISSSGPRQVEPLQLYVTTRGSSKWIHSRSTTLRTDLQNFCIHLLHYELGALDGTPVVMWWKISAFLRSSLLLDALTGSSVLIVDSRFQSSLDGTFWHKDHPALPWKPLCS